MQSHEAHGNRPETKMNITHAKSNTLTYIAWCGIKQRCENPKSQQYPNYGGRGITICARWRNSFENFLADMGEKPNGLQIDRIDCNGGYEPGNCRWVTANEQQRNKRNNHIVEWNGERLPVTAWAERLGVAPFVIYHRLRRGWPIVEAMTKPVGDGIKQNGERHPGSKFTAELVNEIRRNNKAGVSQRALARQHSASKSTIRKIVTGKAWAHIPFPEPL